MKKIFFLAFLIGFSMCVLADADAEAYAYFKEAQQAYQDKHFNKALRLLESAKSIRPNDQTLVLNKEVRNRFVDSARGIQTTREVDGDRKRYYPNQLVAKINKQLAQQRVIEAFEQKQKQPPELAFFTRLIDQDNDGVFYEDEPLELYVHIRNKGQGIAENVAFAIKEQSNLAELNVRKQINAIKPGELQIISLPFKLPRGFNEPELLATLTLDEQDGFSPKPLDIRYQIKPWQAPILDIRLQDYAPILTAGRAQEFMYRLRNIGTTPARNFSLRAELNGAGLQVISMNWPDQFTLFKAGDELNLRLLLKADMQITAAKTHQVEWMLEDKGAKTQADRFQSIAKFDVAVALPDSQFQLENYAVQTEQPLTPSPAIAQLSASKPARLMKNKQRYRHHFALVIGNQDYSKTKQPSVLFALKDADLMSDVFRLNMGIPAAHVQEHKNMTLGEMNTLLGQAGEPGQFQTLINHHAEPVDTVYVYYSGHGVPSMNKAWSAYLMPVDANPYYIDKSGYALDAFYRQLSLLKAKRIVVFLDACFSGNTPSGSLFPNTSAGLLKKPVIAVPEQDERITVFSATDNESLALWFQESGQGLFTHFLAKGLSGEADDGDKRLNLKELFSYVNHHVQKMSAMKASRQIPVLNQKKNMELLTYDY